MLTRNNDGQGFLNWVTDNQDRNWFAWAAAGVVAVGVGLYFWRRDPVTKKNEELPPTPGTPKPAAIAPSTPSTPMETLEESGGKSKDELKAEILELKREIDELTEDYGMISNRYLAAVSDREQTKELVRELEAKLEDVRIQSEQRLLPKEAVIAQKEKLIERLEGEVGVLKEEVRALRKKYVAAQQTLSPAQSPVKRASGTSNSFTPAYSSSSSSEQGTIVPPRALLSEANANGSEAHSRTKLTPTGVKEVSE